MASRQKIVGVMRPTRRRIVFRDEHLGAGDLHHVQDEANANRGSLMVAL